MFEKIKQLIACVYRDKKLLTLVLLLFVTLMDYSICIEVLKDFDAGTNALLMCVIVIKLFYFAVVFFELTKTIKQKKREKSKKKRVLSEEERKIVAIHESGHAVVSLFLESRRIKEVSISSTKDNVKGYVHFEETENHKNLYTQTELQNSVVSILGGMAAEKMFFNETSTGVAHDLKEATEIVVDMVANYGMYPEINLVYMNGRNKKYIESDSYSLCLAKRTNELLLEAEKKAICILERNRVLVEKFSEELLKKGTINEEEVYNIFSAYQTYTETYTV